MWSLNDWITWLNVSFPMCDKIERQPRSETINAALDRTEMWNESDKAKLPQIYFFPLGVDRWNFFIFLLTMKREVFAIVQSLRQSIDEISFPAKQSIKMNLSGPCHVAIENYGKVNKQLWTLFRFLKLFLSVAWNCCFRCLTITL